jgi:tetraacyldisaccharide 4'-kinase
MYSAKLKAMVEAAWYLDDARFPLGVDHVLRGLSLGWQASVALGRRWAIRRCLGVPTVGISSLLVGGSGKTPLTRWVAEQCRHAGKKPAVVTRGYGGLLRGPIRVEPRRHTAVDVGDEPIWLAWNLPDIPVIVARRRVEGCLAGMKNWNADMVVLDDALMLFSLHKDLELLILGRSSWLGNRRCLPAGPLRLPARELTRADAIFLLDEPGEEHSDATTFLRNRPDTIELFRAFLYPTGLVGPDGSCHETDILKDRPVVAWGGIARSWRFRDLILEIGAELCAFFSFPDHHMYSERDISFLREVVAQREAVPLTTAKDLARWPSDAAWRPYCLAVELEVVDRQRAADFILTRMTERMYE